MRIKKLALALATAATLAAGPAAASLSEFATFVGKVGVSTDGFGSTASGGTISANVPVGSTVLAAYLYTSLSLTISDPNGAGNTLAGQAVNYATDLGANGPFLKAFRADVTSIIKPLIDGGPGGLYNFAITEAFSSRQDGEALVVVFRNNVAITVDSTVGILDGFSASGGDSTAINFASPLNTGAPGFFAEMRLGIGFSFDGTNPLDPTQVGQRSTVTVNGTVLTDNAGHCDDAAESCVNGNLITVGGFDDPAVSGLPSIDDDHERYNLVPNITNGDTKISVNTKNPSNDDNIFLAVFHVTGRAGINEPPPPPDDDVPTVPVPGTLLLVGLGMLGLGISRRRRA